MKFEVGTKVRIKRQLSFYYHGSEVTAPSGTIAEVVTKQQWEEDLAKPWSLYGEAVFIRFTIPSEPPSGVYSVAIFEDESVDKWLEPLGWSDGRHCACQTPKPILLLTSTICDNCGKEIK